MAHKGNLYSARRSVLPVSTRRKVKPRTIRLQSPRAASSARQSPAAVMPCRSLEPMVVVASPGCKSATTYNTVQPASQPASQTDRSWQLAARSCPLYCPLSPLGPHVLNSVWTRATTCQPNIRHTIKMDR
ncbi:hypothetical protein COCVIDRAFT_19335 [Bipolaris victoriae FI3]|uniref:Uncharacterized protein n=1 Tax=Bipolaris victoriae (strain FI3) TaxID=930091 RepID=W7EG14_BIPV3|nr:hypothetical protein COCVIDRAFT_19335 [Bipolaris victoriae FI3]